MTRPIRVYRLHVVWPDGKPKRPARRRYLTERGANHHADTLREAGATVTVHPSNPVTWPEATAKGLCADHDHHPDPSAAGAGRQAAPARGRSGPMSERIHLGDGAYAHSDGYCLWVETQRGDTIHRVALEPSAIVALVRFAVAQDPGMGPVLADAAKGGEGR